MKWTTIPLSGPGTNFKEDGSAMVGLQDGRLVIGGYSQPYHDGGEDTSIHCNEEAMSDVAVYSPTNKTWLSLPDLQKGRAAFILLCCEGGRLVALGGSDHYRCYYPAGDDITENLGALDLLTVEALEPGASSWSMLPNAPFSAGAAGDLPGVGLVIVQHDHDSTPGQKRAAWYDWDERVWQELPALPAECQYIESGWVESGRFVVQGPAGPTPEQEAQAAAAGPQFATEQARCSIMCAPDFFSHRFFALDASQPPHLGADPPAGLSHRRRRQLDVQADGVSCAGRLHRTVPPERKLGPRLQSSGTSRPAECQWLRFRGSAAKVREAYGGRVSDKLGETKASGLTRPCCRTVQPPATSTAALVQPPATDSTGHAYKSSTSFWCDRGMLRVY